MTSVGASAVEGAFALKQADLDHATEGLGARREDSALGVKSRPRALAEKLWQNCKNSICSYYKGSPQLKTQQSSIRLLSERVSLHALRSQMGVSSHKRRYQLPHNSRWLASSVKRILLFVYVEMRVISQQFLDK